MQGMSGDAIYTTRAAPFFGKNDCDKGDKDRRLGMNGPAPVKQSK
jgi:hypothetical protein